VQVVSVGGMSVGVEGVPGAEDLVGWKETENVDEDPPFWRCRPVTEPKEKDAVGQIQEAVCVQDVLIEAGSRSEAPGGSLILLQSRPGAIACYGAYARIAEDSTASILDCSSEQLEHDRQICIDLITGAVSQRHMTADSICSSIFRDAPIPSMAPA
jgi:hypothetical protein